LSIAQQHLNPVIFNHMQNMSKEFQNECLTIKIHKTMPHNVPGPICAFYAFIAPYYASDRLQQNEFSGV